MVLLSLGCCNSTAVVHRHLAALHADHGIDAIFDAGAGGLTSSAVYEWAKHIREIERVSWTGNEVGVELVRAALAQAAKMSERPCVMVWGLVPAFVQRERRTWLDVQMGSVIEKVIDAGLSGWAVAGARLLPIRQAGLRFTTSQKRESPRDA